MDKLAKKQFAAAGAIFTALFLLLVEAAWRDVFWLRTEAKVESGVHFCKYSRRERTLERVLSGRHAEVLRVIRCSDHSAISLLKADGYRARGSFWELNVFFPTHGSIIGRGVIQADDDRNLAPYLNTSTPIPAQVPITYSPFFPDSMEYAQDTRNRRKLFSVLFVCALVMAVFVSAFDMLPANEEEAREMRRRSRYGSVDEY
jgi:hypothetical protein